MKLITNMLKQLQTSSSQKNSLRGSERRDSSSHPPSTVVNREGKTQVTKCDLMCAWSSGNASPDTLGLADEWDLGQRVEKVTTLRVFCRKSRITSEQTRELHLVASQRPPKIEHTVQKQCFLLKSIVFSSGTRTFDLELKATKRFSLGILNRRCCYANPMY